MNKAAKNQEKPNLTNPQGGLDNNSSGSHPAGMRPNHQAQRGQHAPVYLPVCCHAADSSLKAFLNDDKHMAQLPTMAGCCSIPTGRNPLCPASHRSKYYF